MTDLESIEVARARQEGALSAMRYVARMVHESFDKCMIEIRLKACIGYAETVLGEDSVPAGKLHSVQAVAA